MTYDICHVVSGNHANLELLQQKLISGKAGNDYILLLCSYHNYLHLKYNADTQSNIKLLTNFRPHGGGV